MDCCRVSATGTVGGPASVGLQVDLDQGALAVDLHGVRSPPVSRHSVRCNWTGATAVKGLLDGNTSSSSGAQLAGRRRPCCQEQAAARFARGAHLDVVGHGPLSAAARARSTTSAACASRPMHARITNVKVGSGRVMSLVLRAMAPRQKNSSPAAQF
jgi:hypothetical protein